MTKSRKIKQPEPPQAGSLEDLKKQIIELQQKELEEVAKKIEAIGEENKVQIGLLMTVDKLADIMKFMVTNNKKTVSLKFEVWKT
jgi:hypothetical protein